MKATLLDPSAGIVAALEAPYSLYSDHPGWAEADPDEWWQNTVVLIGRLLSASGASASDVAAVATTGMAPAVVLLDEHGTPLRRAMLQNDARATVELAELGRELADADLGARTGSALTQQSLAPTLRWVRTHEPVVWQQLAHVVGSYDWLLMQLGAAPHVEDNWSLESGLYEIDGTLAADVLAAAGWPAGSLVPVLRPGEIAGAVSRDAADATGLRAGTPLVVGGADHVLSAYAAGLAQPGQVLVKLGGAGDILIVADGPVVDRRLYLDRHPAPGMYLPNGCMATSGTFLRWFQRELAGGAEFAVLDREADASGAGAGGLVCLPYLLGEKSPIHDAEARGVFAGLDLSTTRGDLFRASLEATGYGFRQHLDVFAELGLARSDVRVTNGGARSRLWKQVVADVCDVPLYPVVGHPGASLGAAIVAAVAVDALPGWHAAERFVTLGPPIEPSSDPTARDTYEEGYSVYCDLWPAVGAISHRLARMGQR
ncbi:MAG: FGGY family carbohydrate kinase [Gaiellales bacterium]